MPTTGSRPFLRRLLVAPFLVQALFVTCAVLALSHTREARLTAYDALCPPFSPVQLRAKLQRDDWLLVHREVAGRRIEFTLNGKPIGEGITDEEGVACLDLELPYGVGDYLVQAGADEAEDLERVRGASLLCVRRPAVELILICDIDGTLCERQDLSFLAKLPSETPPFKQAPETLRFLSEYYTIVYLTHRDDVFAEATRCWLSWHKFPEGPIFFADWGEEVSSQQYKSRRLRELRETFDRLKVGLGDLESDARAYVMNGLSPFIRDPEGALELPAGAHAFRSWVDLSSSKALREVLPLPH